MPAAKKNEEAEKLKEGIVVDPKEKVVEPPNAEDSDDDDMEDGVAAPEGEVQDHTAIVSTPGIHCVVDSLSLFYPQSRTCTSDA